MKIILHEGMDRKLYNLLSDMYDPFLSAQHLKDKFQYTVFSDEHTYPIGILSVNKGKNTFMQIALIPDQQGKDIGRLALAELAKKTGLRRIGWTCEKNNYPSLKLLCSLGGGVTENSVKQKKKKTYEGFFYTDKPISKRLRDVAIGELERAKLLYGDWQRSVLAKRSRERMALREYLVQKIPAFDAHSHQITKSAFGAKLIPEKLRHLVEYKSHGCFIAERFVFGVPDCSVDLEAVNKEVMDYCREGKGRHPIAILGDKTDVEAALRAGFVGFKEHVYGQRLLKDRNGKLAMPVKSRLEQYAKIARTGSFLILHAGPNVVERLKVMLKKTPQLRILLAHLGSPMDHQKPWGDVLGEIDALKDFQNVWFDISAVPETRVIEKALSLVPLDRILWGSDFPYDMPAASLYRLAGCAKVSMDVIEKILSLNADRLIESKK